jgi:AcrR family transcriptional regulator
VHSLTYFEMELFMRPTKVSNEMILQMARLCLAEKGASVSTQFIADQLGVSQATLFKRFGSKVNLLQEAVALPMKVDSLLACLQAESTDAPIREQLEELCLMFLEFFDEALPVWASLNSAGLALDCKVSPTSPPVLVREYFTAWIERLQSEGKIREEVDSESVALALIGAVQHRSVRIHIMKDKGLKRSKEEYISSIVDVIWKGLAPTDHRSS